MKRPAPPTRRIVAALAASALALLGSAAPAHAAPLGTVALLDAEGLKAVTSGTVTANPMFASATASAVCPANHGQNANVKVGREGGTFENLGRSGGAGNYSEKPAILKVNRSLADALGGAPTDGDYLVVMTCTGVSPHGTHPDRFQTVITVTGSNWQVKGAPRPTGTPTTTALAATPLTGDTGTEVTLTATVSPPEAAGTVTFLRPAAAIGTAPVSAGTATLKTRDLPAGGHSLTAVFDPADPGAYARSTSAAVTVKLTPPGGVNAEQTITTQISQGAFTLGLAGNAVTLTGGSIGGTATGQLNQATVTDHRGVTAGWSLTGQVEKFTAGSATIAANQLGWEPSASKVNGSGTATAGAKVAPGTGLGEARTLCKADAAANAGQFSCGAKLTLGIPDSTTPGTYTATLTLTLA